MFDDVSRLARLIEIILSDVSNEQVRVDADRRFAPRARIAALISSTVTGRGGLRRRPLSALASLTTGQIAYLPPGCSTNSMRSPDSSLSFWRTGPNQGIVQP